jgi:hypothetical protein
MSQPRGGLAPLAQAQLAAWRAYAARWYWHLTRRETETGHRLGAGTEQYHAVCAACDTSMAVLMSEGTGYLMNTEQLLDGVTRHLRNQHRGIEADVYGDYRQNTETYIDPRGRRHSNGSATDPS